MNLLQRSKLNPILSPNPQNSWEEAAAFNGSILKDNDIYHMLYRAMSHDQQSVIGHAQSKDGYEFTKRELFISPKEPFDISGCEDPRITKIENEYFIFYTGLSHFPPIAPGIRICVAISEDLQAIKERHLVTPFNAKAMALFPKKINGKYVALLTVNTDMPPARIAIAWFSKKEDIWSPNFWKKWYLELDHHTLFLQKMNADQIEVGAVPVETKDGWLFLFATINNYYSDDKVFGIDAALLDLQDPQKILGITKESLLSVQEKYEHEGIVPHVIFPSGALIEDDDAFRLYYGAADTSCAVASGSLDMLLTDIKENESFPIKLRKYGGNPILYPKQEHNWEAKAVFNAAAVCENDMVHIVYRAQSYDNTSVMGYATSEDGLRITDRSIEPIYHPRMPFEDKKKINQNSGCEDPRVTKINGRFYMTYTAFDSIGPPRVALTSIDVEDFLKKKWQWARPVLISSPGVDDKDACILSEQVMGKYVFFHRVDNDIVLDYVDSLQFDGTKWLRCVDYISLRPDMWDSQKIGISAPPIKTDAGWVLLYHGISGRDKEYRVGAMLLELTNPCHVLSRTQYPILEPEMPFERHGLVDNVVFPCGAVVIKDTLFVYYGAADKVLCASTLSFSGLVNYLKRTQQ